MRTDCPDPETLAAFVDGRLRGASRELVESHVASCEDCYEVFVGTARCVAERPAPRRWRPAVVLPLAAAAALALVVLRPQWPGAVPVPATARPTAMAHRSSNDPDLVALLGHAQDLARLSRQGWEDTAMAHGFAESVTRDRLSFLFGVHRLDLDVALRGGESQSASAVLGRLVGLLEPVEGAAEAVAFYRRHEAQVRSRSSPAALPEPGDMLSRAGLDPEGIAFGRFIEACRLASLGRTAEFFRSADVRARLEAARERGLPLAVARQITTVSELLRQEPESEQDWARLQRAFTQVILLVWA